MNALRVALPLLTLAFAGYQIAAEKIARPFAPFGPAVKTRADAKNFYVESDGMPDHPMMAGIAAWQQQVPLPQRYTGANAWQFPLQPTPAAHPLSARDHFLRGAIAIAANGVPIFNALNNRGEDAFLAGELDRYGGHAGRADDYHYHTAPLHLESKVGRGNPIGYALDGYPLYGLNEPDGAPARGLDAFNGHETRALGYHYHATKTYPYVNGGFHGEVSEIEGQVDPQPRAEPIRPATAPLRGAKITAFERPAPGRYALTYSLNGRDGKVDYRRESDGSYTFTYQPPDGPVETRNYRSRQRGPGRRQDAPPPQTPPASPAGFLLSSPAVAADGALPVAYTCDGESVSPPLAWKGAPAGTRSFALVMHHVPRDGEPHVYWVVYNLPADRADLPRDDRKAGARGVNTINRRAVYAPPCSQGPGRKWYTVTLYALSSPPDLQLPAPVTRESLLAALKDKTLGATALNVSYERPSGADRP